MNQDQAQFYNLLFWLAVIFISGFLGYMLKAVIHDEERVEKKEQQREEARRNREWKSSIPDGYCGNYHSCKSNNWERSEPDGYFRCKCKPPKVA